MLLSQYSSLKAVSRKNDHKTRIFHIGRGIVQIPMRLKPEHIVQIGQIVHYQDAENKWQLGKVLTIQSDTVQVGNHEHKLSIQQTQLWIPKEYYFHAGQCKLLFKF